MGQENLSEKPGWGFLIKSAPPRGAFVRNIIYEDSTLSVASKVMSIWTKYPSEGPPPQGGLTDIRNITYRNIVGTATQGEAGDWECSEDRACKEVYLFNVTVKESQGWKCANVGGKAK